MHLCELPGKDGDGTVDGYVTNIHVSDMRVDGPIPRELCLFEHLRELDLDGGRLSGPLPEFLSTCFPNLAEMDLSYNRVCILQGFSRGGITHHLLLECTFLPCLFPKSLNHKSGMW